MHDELHPAVDEYLETIGWLEEEGVPVVAARIAARMGKSRPSVSEMLARLAARGYVERSDRHILLTPAGRTRALAAIRRRRLAECLLADVVGLPFADVHLEAGRVAGVISDEVAERLVELLGDPATCPHGNPIPGGGGASPEPAGQIRVADASPGRTVRLVRMTHDLEGDRASLRYLGGAGFVPGASAVVLERGPDGTVVLSVGADKLALGPSLCERLFVVAL